MFETTIGPVKDSGTERLPAARDGAGHLHQLQDVLQIARRRPPFGIAEVGKLVRNETPRALDSPHARVEQMEMEFFVPPAQADEWFRYWVEERRNWYVRRYGIRPDNIRIRAHDASELSHYSSGTSDLEYLFPIGWGSSRASPTAATTTSSSTPSSPA